MHTTPNSAQDLSDGHVATPRRPPPGAVRWCRYAALGGVAVFLAGAGLPVSADATPSGQEVVTTVAPDVDLGLYIAGRKMQMAQYRVDHALELGWFRPGAPL